MNNVAFYGGETAGSLAKIYNNPTTNTPRQTQVAKLREQPEQDTVNFKGHDNYEKKSSWGKKLAVLASVVALTVGGLGYAHKANWIEKIGNAKVKEYTNKIAEPCHNACKAVKGWAKEGWEKLTGLFQKK